MLVWAALAAAALAAAPQAMAQTINFGGAACGGTVQSPGNFTVRATATDLSGPMDPIGAYAVYLDVSDYATPKVTSPLMDANFTQLVGFTGTTVFVSQDIEPATDTTPADGNHRYTFGGVAFNTFDVPGTTIDLVDIAFAVPASQTGTITITPIQDAGNGASSSINDVALAAGTPCVVDIALGPQPPTADAGPDRTVDEGAAGIVIDGSGTDNAPPSNLTFAWSVVSGGAFGTLTNANQEDPTFTPVADVNGNQTVTLRLTVTDPDFPGSTSAGDKGVGSTDDMVVTVVDASALNPVADAGADQAVVEGGAVSLDGTGSQDNNGADNLTFAWATVPPGQGSFDDNTSATPMWTSPSVTVSTPVTIRLTVTDPDGGSDTDDAIVTVSNLGITANAGADRNVAEGAAAITLNGQGTDGALPLSNITFAWSVVSGGTAGGTLSNANMQNATFTPNADVDCNQPTVIRLTVTDPDCNGTNCPMTATDDVTVTTTDTDDSCPDDAPTANAGPDQSVNEGASVALNGSASVDREGADNITFAWAKVVGGDPGTISNPTAETATFNSAQVDGDRAVMVRLTVTDPDVSIGSNSSQDVTQVTIVDTNCSGKAPLTITSRPPNATPLELDLDAVVEGDEEVVNGARHNNTCATSSRVITRLVYNVLGLDESEEIPDFDGFSIFLAVDADGDGVADEGETRFNDVCELIGDQVVCDLSGLSDGNGGGGFFVGAGGFEDLLLGVRAEEDAPAMASVGLLSAALLGGLGMFLFSLAAPTRARRLLGRGVAAALLVLAVGGAGLTACHGSRGFHGPTTQTLNFRVDLITVDVNGPADSGLPIQGRDVEVTFTPSTT